MVDENYFLTAILEKDVYESNRGREFYLVFLRYAFDPQLFSHIIITSYDHPAIVYATNKLNGSVSKYSIARNGFIEFTIDTNLTLISNGTQNKVMHILADQDISMAVYQSDFYEKGGYRALPVRTYGLDYVTAQYTSVMYETGFAIVASEDNTSVTVKPALPLIYQSQMFDFTTPINITLQKSEVFYFDAITDFTGTVINSDRPIGVFGNHGCGHVPTVNYTCDYMISQYPPVKYLGKTYILTIFPSRTIDQYRIIGAYNNTSVSVPHISLNITLEKGYFTEFHLTSNAVLLECDKPCLVIHYNRGFLEPCFEIADPSMAVTPAIDQFLSYYFIYVSFDLVLFNCESYITVIILESEKNGLRLDHQPLPSATWYNTTTSHGTYAVASFLVSHTTHLVNHVSSNVKFGLLRCDFGLFGMGTTATFPGGFQFYSTFRCK